MSDYDWTCGECMEPIEEGVCRTEDCPLVGMSMAEREEYVESMAWSKADGSPAIEDDDYVISDQTRGGYMVNNGLGEYEGSLEEIILAIRTKMDADKFWPNVWFVNDHGNTDLLSINHGGSYDIAKSWV